MSKFIKCPCGQKDATVSLMFEVTMVRYPELLWKEFLLVNSIYQYLISQNSCIANWRKGTIYPG